MTSTTGTDGRPWDERLWLAAAALSALVLLVVTAAGCDGSGAAADGSGPWIITNGGGTNGGQGPGGIDPDAPEHYARSLAALTSVEDCGELEEELRAAAIREMEQRLDEVLQQLLEWGPCGYWYAEDAAAGGGNGGPYPAPGAREGAGEYSTTNNQIAGVDEADFVKNDGSYIYILADGRFQIVEAWPAEEARVIASRGIEGDVRKLFVHEGVAVVYSALEPLPQPDYDPWGFGYGMPWDGGGGYQECTYGYDCDFTGDGRALKITVFDIADVTDPQLVREIELSGSYINSRRIGAAVHTVAFFPGAVFPGVRYYPEELGELCNQWDWQNPESMEPQLQALFDVLREENRAAIEGASIVDFLPGVRDTRYVDGRPVTEEGLLEDCRSVYVSQQDHGDTFLAMLSFDMTALGALDATTIIGRPGAVYASASGLYVSARHQQAFGGPWFWEGEDAPEEASTVHKFHLLNDPPRTFYAGSGVVKGRVLNQFAMDEFEGYLRIATTSGHLPSPDVHSTLSVLGESGGALVTVGQVDGIAPTEDIRSVRFDGARGFMVTFKKTDPLFTFDLADPTRPEIAGELKIPGYSTYMHLMDEDHLLTIGYDADDQGDFAWFQGIMLQIFDISDLRDPRLTHKVVIGSRGSTSEAATNHLAFTYFPQRDLLALPMTVCEGGSGGSYGDLMTFSGLMVYRVTTGTGFDYLGGVSHVLPESEDNYWGACGSWWTDSNSIVKRSIFMDDFVYSITEEEIRVDNVYDLGTDVAVVPLVAD